MMDISMGIPFDIHLTDRDLYLRVVLRDLSLTVGGPLAQVTPRYELTLVGYQNLEPQIPVRAIEEIRGEVTPKSTIRKIRGSNS